MNSDFEAIPDINQYLTDEVRERAAKALWDEPGWEQAAHEQRQHHREAAERALSAVAPLIAAQALRDAATGYQTGGWAEDLPTGGSRPALILGMGQRAAAWLRARADQIEAGR